MREKLMGQPMAEICSVRVDGEWIGVKGGMVVGTDDVVSWTGWPSPSNRTLRYSVPLAEIKGVCCDLG